LGTGAAHAYAGEEVEVDIGKYERTIFIEPVEEPGPSVEPAPPIAEPAPEPEPAR
jgi:hypothetical protein